MVELVDLPAFADEQECPAAKARRGAKARMNRRVVVAAAAALIFIVVLVAVTSIRARRSPDSRSRSATTEVTRGTPGASTGKEASKSGPTKSEVAKVVTGLASRDPKMVARVVSRELQPYAKEIAAGAVPEGSKLEVDYGSLKMLDSDLASVSARVGAGKPQVMLFQRVEGAWVLEGTTSTEEQVP